MTAFIFAAVFVLTPLVVADVNLSWQDNSDNEDGFYIERSENGSEFTRIASLPSDTTSFEDRSVEAGVFYRYRVQAFNAFGVSGYTNVSTFEIPKIETFEEWIARMIVSGFYDEQSLSPDSSLGPEDVPYLLCYAHGINPYRPDRSLLPKLAARKQNENGELQILQAVNKYSTGLVSTLLVSHDLVEWTPHEFEAIPLKETTLHRWEAIPLPDLGQNCFYRLECSIESTSNF